MYVRAEKILTYSGHFSVESKLTINKRLQVYQHSFWHFFLDSSHILFSLSDDLVLVERTSLWIMNWRGSRSSGSGSATTLDLGFLGPDNLVSFSLKFLQFYLCLDYAKPPCWTINSITAIWQQQPEPGFILPFIYFSKDSLSIYSPCQTTVLSNLETKKVTLCSVKKLAI